MPRFCTQFRVTLTAAPGRVRPISLKTLDDCPPGPSKEPRGGPAGRGSKGRGEAPPLARSVATLTSAPALTCSRGPGADRSDPAGDEASAATRSAIPGNRGRSGDLLAHRVCGDTWGPHPCPERPSQLMPSFSCATASFLEAPRAETDPVSLRTGEGPGLEMRDPWLLSTAWWG